MNMQQVPQDAVLDSRTPRRPLKKVESVLDPRGIVSFDVTAAEGPSKFVSCEEASRRGISNSAQEMLVQMAIGVDVDERETAWAGASHGFSSHQGRRRKERERC